MEEENPKPACLDGAAVVRWPAGTQLFKAGDECANFVYLVSGSVRVDLLTSTGRSVVLYRFGEAETCILTTSCLIGHQHYCAEAVVEKDAAALLLNSSQFQIKLVEDRAFQHLVFSSFASRLSSLMGKIEDVAFGSIDVRLASRICELAAGKPDIKATHEQLSADIGSAREVVSRKLAQWEAKGLVERRRGGLRLLDLDELKNLTGVGN